MKPISARKIIKDNEKIVIISVTEGNNTSSKERQIKALDVFASERIDFGKLTTNIAYELKKGRGSFKKFNNSFSTIFTIVLYYIDENDKQTLLDIKTNICFSESVARGYLDKLRDALISKYNRELERKEERKIKEQLEQMIKDIK